MHNLAKLKNFAFIALFSAIVLNPLNVFAAETEETVNSAEQEQAAVVESEYSETEEQNNNFDAKNAVDELNKQIAELKAQIEEQQNNQGRIWELVERLENLERERAECYSPTEQIPAADLSGHLVYPDENYDVRYTQDAANSQGNSTVIFRYAPNQLYKIYCRVGYLTDLSLKKGEKVSFVGGGDTSAWAVNSSTVDGVPHIYIKPTVETSNTNLIITTNKRSYQLILNTSGWYNPMVIWTYGQEEQAEALAQKEKDERTIDATFDRNYESLYFNYSTSGDSEYKPETVFDDGERTFIKFRKLPARIPALFIKEKGKKGISMANYTTKNNVYILDRVVNEINLRFDEDETVKIKRNE